MSNRPLAPYTNTGLPADLLRSSEAAKGNPRFITDTESQNLQSKASILTMPTVDRVQLYTDSRKNPKSIFIEKGSNWVK
jgi:hypothetical protein